MRHALAWRRPQDPFTIIYKAIQHTGRTHAEIQLIVLSGVHKRIQLFIQKRIQPFGNVRFFVMFCYDRSHAVLSVNEGRCL